MYYLCLLCGKIMKGLGLPPHFSYKHPEEAKDLRWFEREDHGMWRRYHDYYSNGKLMAVCIGDDKSPYTQRKLEMWIKVLKKRSPKA